MGYGTMTYEAKRATALADPATGGTGAAVFKQADNSALAAFVAFPRSAQSNSSVVDGRPFKVRASGLVTIGSAGTTTFLPGLYYSAGARTQITIVAGNLVAGVASTALTASGTFPWWVEFIGVWESTVGALGGRYEQYVAIASGYTVPVVTITLLAAANLATDGAGFVCGCTMGTSRTGTLVTMKSFTLEVL